MGSRGTRFIAGIAAVCAGLALCAALPSGDASAQEFEKPDYHPGTFTEAHEEATKSHRLHMVFLLGSKPGLRDAADRLWRNRSLNQWVRWHAVLTRVSEAEDPALFEWFAAQLKEDGGDSWDPYRHLTIVVFRGERTQQILPWFPHSDTRRGAPEFVRYDTGRLELKPLEVLHQMQFVLDKLEALDPAWLATHNHKNPPPPAPPRVWFSTIADENAPIAVPREGEGVLSMVERARAEAASGALADATASYTWVWERLDEGRPWMRPLRWTLIAAEMRDLALRREGTMKRFAAMRDEQASREPWLELRERFDRYLLDEVVDQLEASLLELDYLLHDTDESSLLTRSENAGISLIMSGMPWLDTWKVSDDDVKRVSRLEKQLGDKAPPTATDEDWSHVQAFRRAVLLSESCRIHAAFLKLGRDADAMKVAEAQIATDADGTSRMALAAVAWGAGVADERHAAWVEEARALGADDAGLGARLGAPSGPPEGDSGASPRP